MKPCPFRATSFVDIDSDVVTHTTGGKETVDRIAHHPAFLLHTVQHVPGIGIQFPRLFALDGIVQQRRIATTHFPRVEERAPIDERLHRIQIDSLKNLRPQECGGAALLERQRGSVRHGLSIRQDRTPRHPFLEGGLFPFLFLSVRANKFVPCLPTINLPTTPDAREASFTWIVARE